MICLFVDETGDSKFKDYFGLSCTAVKHNFYENIKRDFQKILLKYGWDPSVEFKGSCLFSASKGCENVTIEQRVKIAEEIIDLNIANKNARMKFAYFSKKDSTDQKADYLTFLPKVIERVLKTYSKTTGQGKSLVNIYCDRRTDISINEIRLLTKTIIEKSGYFLFEDVSMVDSNFETVGILYADIVGYLMARIDTISNDSELFENLSPEMLQNNGKIKKLISSQKLIDMIKNLTVYGEKK